jgi:hypothetical protein
MIYIGSQFGIFQIDVQTKTFRLAHKPNTDTKSPTAALAIRYVVKVFVIMAERIPTALWFFRPAQFAVVHHGSSSQFVMSLPNSSTATIFVSSVSRVSGTLSVMKCPPLTESFAALAFSALTK